MRKQLLITLSVAAIGVASYATTFMRFKTADGKIVRYEVNNVVEVDFEDEIIPQDTTSAPNYTCVDLGLTSGILWASYNIGATKPEEYGTYFAWGETEPKYIYKWDTYKYGKGIDYLCHSITKYNISENYGIIDSLSTLLSEDDAATANWGKEWRMPTHYEQSELKSECKYSWIENNGVYGAKFTGPNGNSVFFPAAGYRKGSVFYYVDQDGEYWSSQIDGNVNRAHNLSIDKDYHSWNASLRCVGLPVRAVRAKNEQNIHTVKFFSSDSILIETQSVKEGSSAKEVKVPAKPGYEFVGWSTSFKYVSSNISVYAIYKEAYVDLGLPSGTKWATVNVGAMKPEEYGDYFAWGETKPKNLYDWRTYKYATTTYNPSLYRYELMSLTKYNFGKYHGGIIDSLSVLLPEDDAATVNWGSAWRMPTNEEQMELLKECEYSWTEINGVYGAKFTGPNGNSVFFPAAGYYGEYGYDVDDYGDYWSSSLYESSEETACGLKFKESKAYWINYVRHYGFPVRAVRVHE